MDRVGAVPLGQVEQHHEPGGALTRVPMAEFEAVEPMIRSPSQWPGTARVGDLGGSLADVDHGGDAAPSFPDGAADLADGPAGTQAFGQVTAQLAAALEQYSAL